MFCGVWTTERGSGTVDLASYTQRRPTILRLVDTNWHTRTTLATWPDGWPFLQRLDRAGKDRVLLRYTEVHATATGELIKRPGPSLLFFDQEEAVVWHAP